MYCEFWPPLVARGFKQGFIFHLGIFQELGEDDRALMVFKKGEEAFFQVLGHMLSCNTLKLDQCPATIAPMRQLALNQASLLKEPGIFANVIMRWKCLFKELRTDLLRHSPEDVFGAFFKWYAEQLTSPKAISADDLQANLLKQMQQEELLLRTSAKSTLAGMGESTYALMYEHLPERVITIDYIFFAPLKENPLLEANCVVCDNSTVPMVCSLNYKALRNQAAVVTRLISLSMADENEISQQKISTELALLANIIFPPRLTEFLKSRIGSHLYISPDSNIAGIPIDLLPVSLGSAPPIPLFEQFSVSILPSMRKLFLYNNNEKVRSQVCSIIGNPNFDLCKSTSQPSTIENIIDYFCNYFNLSVSLNILEQLPYSQDEIDFISHLLKSHGMTVQSLVGDKAVLSSVLSLENPILVHISSHACSGAKKLSAFRGNFFDDLQSSAIALAGFNTVSKEQFDRLQSDCGPAQLPPLAIFSLKLCGTKLVYLSTCDSAAGTAPMQEAVDNLAEAFLIAGAETVIASLWPVVDHLASEFSKLFYEKLINPNVRPSEALAYARQCFKRLDNSHWPCYAAFMCYGLDKALFL